MQLKRTLIAAAVTLGTALAVLPFTLSGAEGAANGTFKVNIKLPANYQYSTDAEVRLVNRANGGSIYIYDTGNGWGTNCPTCLSFERLVPPGEYSLSIGRASGEAVTSGWFWNSAPENLGRLKGTVVTVTSGGVTKVPAFERKAANTTISGRLVRPNGTPRANQPVHALGYSPAGLTTRSDYTDANGYFHLRALVAGTYSIVTRSGTYCDQNIWLGRQTSAVGTDKWIGKFVTGATLCYQ